MKRSRISTVLIGGILFLSAVVFVGGCRKAGLWLVKEDPTEHADAIIMLMGGISDRVLQVADQYEQGVSGKILLVEESMGGAYYKLEKRGARLLRKSEQVSNVLIELGIPADSIIVLPGDAVSTQMEAIIVRDYLESNPGVRSVLLVSSASHMRRASLIFTAAFKPLKHQVQVRCSPSNYSGFNPEKWWKRKEDIQHVVLEYMKMGSFILFEKRELRD